MLVAGRLVCQEALTAIGLMAPFNFVVAFLSAVINGGTLLAFTWAVDRFDRRRANEVFSQGIISALPAGFLLFFIMLWIRDSWIGESPVPVEILPYLRDYYDMIAVLNHYTLTHFNMDTMSSFLHYVVSRVLTFPKNSRYVQAAGYNRNEFYFDTAMK